MEKLKDYKHLNRMGKSGYWKYVFFGCAATVVSLCAVLNKVSFFDDGFLMILLCVIAVDSLFWLPLLFKTKSFKAKLKKFSDDELVMINDAVSEISRTDKYCVAEGILIILNEKIEFIRIKDILWIYGEHIHTTHKMYGLKYGTSDTYQTAIIGKNGKILCNARFLVLEQLYPKLAPYNDEIIYGYSDEARYIVQKYLESISSKQGDQRGKARRTK